MPINLNQFIGKVGVLLLFVIFITYFIANHFETVVPLSFLMQFSYVQIIYLLQEP